MTQEDQEGEEEEEEKEDMFYIRTSFLSSTRAATPRMFVFPCLVNIIVVRVITMVSILADILTFPREYKIQKYKIPVSHHHPLPLPVMILRHLHQRSKSQD